MEFRAKQIAPPKNWERFEDLCHTLFKEVSADPLAQKHGRRGQAQQGVDVFGSQMPSDRDFTVFSARARMRSRRLGYLRRAGRRDREGRHFFAKAWALDLATTAPVDAALQRAARELSAERAKQDLFTVSVLGWEEVQGLMADAPGVVEEFYPEAAFDLPALLRELKTIAAKVAALDSGAPGLGRATHSRTETSSHGQAAWLPIAFDKHRDLGPALMGRALGPADAATCPRLPEADVLVLQLRNAFSTRLVGIPGAGKSVCAYQAALRLAEEGWYEILHFVDPEAADIGLVRSKRRPRPRSS